MHHKVNGPEAFPIRPRARKEGFLIVLVLGAIIALGIMFFSLSSNSLRARQTTVRVMEEEFSLQATQVVADCFWETFEEVIRSRQGSPFLFPSDFETSPLNVLNGSSEISRGTITLDFFNPEHFDKAEPLRAELLARFPEIERLSCKASMEIKEGTTQVRNLELNAGGRITLEIGFTYKRTQMEFHFKFHRAFKVAQILPAVVSKFTLFVRKVPSPECFNQCPKGFNDDFVPGANVLTLHHAPPTNVYTADLWKRSGWVFLGGGEVNLNIDGSRPTARQSESFLFFLPNARSGKFLNPSTVSDYLGDSKMRVKISPLGCCKELLNGDEASVSFINAIANPLWAPEGLSGGLENLDKASNLRLFGDRGNPTPTRVIGKVFARYVFGSSLILDADPEDRRADRKNLGGKGPYLIAFVLPRVTDPARYNPPWWPTLFGEFIQQTDIRRDFAGLEGLETRWDKFFPKFDPQSGDNDVDYKSVMCKVSRPDFLDREAAFNRMYDVFFEGITDPNGSRERQFPPAARIISPTDSNFDEYPRTPDDPNFQLTSDGFTGNPLWKGNLATLFQGEASPYHPSHFEGQGFASQFSRVYPSQSAFREEWAVPYSDPPEISIDRPVIARIEGPLEITELLSIKAPVILVTEKDLKISSSRVGPEGRLVLCSQEGNVEYSGKEPLRAQILAPSGTFKWEHPLWLQGTLFVDSLDTGQIKSVGGTIDYDPEVDSTERKNFVRNVTLLFGPRIPVPVMRK